MVFEKQRVLVTGGAGFIGSFLVEELVNQGAVVTVLDNLSTGCPHNLRTCEDQIHFLEASLSDDSWEPALSEKTWDGIFHLASTSYVPPSIQDPFFDLENNAFSTLRLLEFTRTHCPAAPFLYASSAAVYGNPAVLPITEATPLAPISPYGVSKLATEQYVSVYAQVHGLPAASLRLFSVYGPRQRKQIVFDFLEKLRRNPDQLEILGDGTQARDLVYVADVVQAFLRVRQTGALQGEVYNVASGQAHTTRQIAEEVARVIGARPEFLFTDQLRPGDADKWSCDIARLLQLGGPPPGPLSQGLAAVWSWYQQEGGV